MTLRSILLAAPFLAMAPVASAQVTVSTVLDSGQQTEPTPADKLFFAQGAQSTEYELKLAELAAQNATSEKIRHHAQIVADDDRAYLQALRNLAAQCYLDVLSPLSDDQQERIQTLHVLKGAAFDHAYSEAFSDSLDADAQLTGYEAATTFNPHIRDLIAKYDQIRQSHQEQTN
jgi:predicted outer membrane protein